MLFRLQIGPGGLKQEEAAAKNVINSVAEGKGGRNSRLRLVVGVSVALLGATNSLLFFLLCTTSVHRFLQYFQYFFIVFPAPRSGDSFPNACEKFVDNIFVPISLWKYCCNHDEVFNWFRSTFKRNGPCHLPHAPMPHAPMPPHGSASIFVRFRESAREINFNRSRAGKKEEYENFCNKELSYNSFFVTFFRHNGENRNRDWSSEQLSVWGGGKVCGMSRQFACLCQLIGLMLSVANCGRAKGNVELWMRWEAIEGMLWIYGENYVGQVNCSTYKV